MRFIYGIGAGIGWAYIMYIWLVGIMGMEMPPNSIQILSFAIIIAGAMAGGD